MCLWLVALVVICIFVYHSLCPWCSCCKCILEYITFSSVIIVVPEFLSTLHGPLSVLVVPAFLSTLRTVLLVYLLYLHFLVHYTVLLVYLYLHFWVHYTVLLMYLFYLYRLHYSHKSMYFLPRLRFFLYLNALAASSSLLKTNAKTQTNFCCQGQCYY